MTEQRDSHPLPEVTPADLFILEAQKVIDPSLHERWMEIASKNPLLARAILAEAKNMFTAAKYGDIEIHELTDEEIVQLAVDISSFAIAALGNAFERKIDEFNAKSFYEGQPETSADGDGDSQL